jgi:hypothetical protein
MAAVDVLVVVGVEALVVTGLLSLTPQAEKTKALATSAKRKKIPLIS